MNNYMVVILESVLKVIKDHNPPVVDGTLNNIYSKRAYDMNYGEILVDYEESTYGDDSNEILNNNDQGNCQHNVLISGDSVSSTSASNNNG